MFSKHYVVRALLVSVVAGLISGCVKKREDLASFGSGLQTGDTVQKSTIDGTSFPLITKAKIADGNNSFAAQLVVEKDVEFMNNYGYVEFETTASMLPPDIKIKAQENNAEGYKIVYKIEGNYLNVLKVAKKELIPSDEMTYAISLADGTYGVPLVAYPISYYVVRNARNEDNRQTNTLVEIPVTDTARLKTATHVRVNSLQGTLFKALDKRDMFPKEVLTSGDWQLTVEIVDVADDIGAGGESTSYIGGGNRGGFEGYNFAKPVRAVSEVNRVVIENLNIAKEYANKPQNFKEVLSIPVKEWFNFRVQQESAGRGNEEINYIQESDPTSRPYVQLDFLAIVCPHYCASLPADMTDKTLSKVIVAKNMISWFIKTKSVTIRYNLVKPEALAANFISRSYPQDDEKKFGLFTTMKDYTLALDVNQNNIETFYQNRLITRLAPGQVVEYHPTGESANEPFVDELGQKAADVWNKVFIYVYKNYKDVNGRPVPPPVIKYNAQRVDKGDPRYFKIDFTSPNDSATAGGVGPWFPNELTGQIFAATSHIHVGINKFLSTDIIQKYLYTKIGVYSGTVVSSEAGVDFVTPKSNAVMEVAEGDALSWPLSSYVPAHLLDGTKFSPDDNNWTLSWMPAWKNKAQANGIFDFVSLAPQTSINAASGVDVNNPQEYISALTDTLRSSTLSRNYYNHKLEPFSIAAKGAVYLVEKLCPGVVAAAQTFKRNLENARAAQNLPADAMVVFEIPQININEEAMMSCRNELLKESLYGTIIHEMGHNFGLMHNYKASADKDNFPTQLFVDTVYGRGLVDFDENLLGTSSVMDYHFYYNPTQNILGPYDIAAIRYAYTGMVEAEDGRLLSVVTGLSEDGKTELIKPIAQIMTEASLIQKPYGYCDDGDAGMMKDPMCAQFDVGTTPSEVVENVLNDYRYYSEISQKSLERVFPGSEQGRVNRIVRLYFVKMKRFYDQWRVELKRVTGSDEQYLEKFDLNSWSQYLATLTDDGTPGAKTMQEYFKVRNLVFNFFQNEAFALNHYCEVDFTVVNNPNPKKNYVEFSTIRDLMKFTLGENRTSTASSCFSPDVSTAIEFYLKQNFNNVKSFIVRGEVGTPLNSYHYSLSPLEVDRPYDVFGNGGIRLNALYNLVNRAPLSIEQYNDNFYPNMMDEPDLRFLLLQSILDRVTEGVRISPEKGLAGADRNFYDNVLPQAVGGQLAGLYKYEDFLSNPLAKAHYLNWAASRVASLGDVPNTDTLLYDNTKALTKFNEEKDFAAQFVRLYIAGLMVPGKVDITIRRMMPFTTVGIPNYYAGSDSYPGSIDMGRYFLIARPEATVAQLWIDTYNQVDRVTKGHYIFIEKMRDFVNIKTQAALNKALQDIAEDSSLAPNSSEFFRRFGSSTSNLKISDLNKVYEALMEAVADPINNLTPYEQALVSESIDQILSRVGSNTKVYSVDYDQELSLGQLVNVVNQLTRQLNQLGQFGDALNEEQAGVKAILRTRITNLEALIKTAQAQLANQSLNGDFSTQTILTVLEEKVQESNDIQNNMTGLRGELESQKELIKMLLTFI